MRFAVPSTSRIIDVEPRATRFIEGFSDKCPVCDKTITRQTGHFTLNGCIGCTAAHCETAVRRNARL